MTATAELAGKQYRMTELMCGAHRQTILQDRLWPEGLVLGNGVQCADCQNTVRFLQTGHARIIPGVSHEELSAVHEAGHAVTHLRLATDVICAALEPGDIEGSAAYVSLSVDETSMGSLANLAGSWGGQSATRHWLYLTGQLDEAAMVDVVSTSRHDASQIIAWAKSEEDITTAMRAADEITWEYWPAIRRVADALLSDIRLTGDQVARIAGLPKPAGTARLFTRVWRGWHRQIWLHRHPVAWRQTKA